MLEGQLQGPGGWKALVARTAPACGQGSAASNPPTSMVLISKQLIPSRNLPVGLQCKNANIHLPALGRRLHDPAATSQAVQLADRQPAFAYPTLNPKP